MKKNKNILNSFSYAFSGIILAFKEEKNLRIHMYITILVIFAGIYFNILIHEWIICIIMFGFVITLELVNTAIETTVDIAMPDIDPKAKIAKDISAGAVLISTITSVIVGLIIFIPKLM